MAYSLASPAVGRTDDIHDSARNTVGRVVNDVDGRKWIYLAGVASCVEGSVVTYDELGVTALIAANAIGPVAVAGAAIVANKYGWFCIFAPQGVTGRIAASSAVDTRVGREGADGVVGDGRTAGDEIYNMVSRTATTTAAAGTLQFAYPFVDDANGA